MSEFNQKKYARPSVAADVVLFSTTAPELEVLLIKRGSEGDPTRGRWALPGGFVTGSKTPDDCAYDIGSETFLQAAKRELFEETGIKNACLEQLFTFSEPGRDERGWIISCAFLGFIDKSGVQPKAGDDAAAAEWFKIKYTANAGTRRELNLTNESGVQLNACLDMKGSGGGEPDILKQSSQLAFDHAKIIAYALEVKNLFTKGARFVV